MRWTLTMALGLALYSTALAALGEETDAERHFRERVHPLLASRCVSCHGPDQVKGGLRLDSREASLRGGSSGPALVPGRPEESLLVQAVLHTKPELEMPPREKLTPADIAVLERWISDGVPWPAPAVPEGARRLPSQASKDGDEARPEPRPTGLKPSEPGTQVEGTSRERLGNAWTDPRNPITRLWGGRRLDLWSFKPLIGTAALPAEAALTPALSRRTGEGAGFGGARLPPSQLDGNAQPARQPPRPAGSVVTGEGPEANGRSDVGASERLNRIDRYLPSAGPEPDRRVLLRRLRFGVTGLPPSAEEVKAFERDPAPDAYEQAVARLLDSPAYGEHQARQWLDVIRYSDSNGFDWDEYRPNAWRFRDYVIRSFNADKPFDQFILEQLAGDELLEGPPTTSADQDRLVATGYLRLGPQDNSAPLFNEQARARAEWMFDLVETTGSAFLGLTMSCARCHDHKYDPVSQADYYRLRAFFEPLRYAEDVPLDLEPEQAAIRRHNEALDAQIQPLATRRDARLREVKERLRVERTAGLAPEDFVLIGTPPERAVEELKPYLSALRKQVEPSDDEARKAFREEQKQADDAEAMAVAALEKQRRDYTRGLLATDTTEPVPPTRILHQGNPQAERDAVVPGFLSALDPNPAPLAKPRNPHTTGRRLTLARWIASPDNPLTARVLVNRLWQQHFGRGLVDTANDFGLAGARPAHPELLDWLAGELIQQGWSLKKLHRLILTSAAYRQDTALRRLSAEQLRDAMLATSGLLHPSGGGSPVWPELPAEVLQANPAFLDDNAERTKGWYPSPPERQGVRAIYLVQKRTVRVPFLETFDLPENSTSCPRRTLSTVAPQALSLLNSPFAVHVANALAARVARESDSAESDQITHAFALTFQRSPTPAELERCASFLRENSLVEFCRVLLNVNEFLYLD